jgi:hypothetical protein
MTAGYTGSKGSESKFQIPPFKLRKNLKIQTSNIKHQEKLEPRDTTFTFCCKFWKNDVLSKPVAPPEWQASPHPLVKLKLET